MINLININKTYISKSKIKVEALKGINLTFENTGFSVIVGPSGCGKSTLLNLIGGLDEATSGEIIVDGCKLNSNYFDSLRNQYVGFIYQEFNLISDLNVYENLELVCYDKSKNEKKLLIKEVLEKVDLASYEKRYPYELSGGEIQRVAIARCLLKDYKILLADEPTGNLNVEMSLEIFKLLKEISEKKLVIVVTHNKELALKFADRIIKIEDGVILDDTSKINSITSCDGRFDQKLNRLSNKMILKMALKNLFQKKFKYVISLLTLVLLFTLLSISFSVIDFNPSYMDYQNIVKNDFENFYVRSWTRDDDKLTVNNVKEITTKYDIEYILNGEIETKDDLVRMGLELYDNCLPLTIDGVYILDSYLLSSQHSGLVFYDKDGFLEVPKEESIENLVGSYISFYQTLVKVEGIIKSNNTNNLLSRPKGVEYDISLYENTTVIFYMKDSIYKKILSQQLDGFWSSESNFTVSINDFDLSDNYLLYSSKFNWTGMFNDEKIYLNDNDNQNLFNLNDNEVYVSLELYNKLFNELSPIEYYIGNDYFEGNLIRKPTHIGETVDLTFIFDDGGKSTIENLIIKGIMFETMNYELYVSNSLCEKFYDLTVNSKLMIKTSSVEDLYSFIKDVKNSYNVSIYYPYTSGINDLSVGITAGITICYVVFSITLIVIVLVTTMTVSYTVKSKNKENGILRSIGISTRDIKKIYLWQLFLMILIPFVLSVIGSYFGVRMLNYLMVVDYTLNLHILFFKLWYIPIMLIFIVLITFIIVSLSLKESLGKKVNPIVRQN